MQKSLSEYSEETFEIISPRFVVETLKARQWKNPPYKAQNWGNWLHHMSAYVGKMKPAMANVIIKTISKPGQKILDPFSGVGTVPLEADLEGRVGIGLDLNPYAFAITRAKFDRHEMTSHLEWLNSQKMDTTKVDISKVSDFAKQFYHPETLKEILLLKERMENEKRYFLIGCLLGIIHGHRVGHLSAKTSLVIPYEPTTEPEYRSVIPRLRNKVERMYINDFPLSTSSKAIFGDARKIPLEDESVDHIVSSPPYYDTLDYVQDNKLRIEFSGIHIVNRNKL